MHEANRALRVGDWKIVSAGDDAPWELYDLKTDRCEAHDLADKQSDKVRELADIWHRQTKEILALAMRDLPAESKVKAKKPTGK